eukprot:snap_masked-scaffold_59-processed-gene-0.41-mRNA-1 protein AED:1.00 eAED:1.00 QI:0/0/0/0/1/1/2/0/63
MHLITFRCIFEFLHSTYGERFKSILIFIEGRVWREGRVTGGGALHFIPSLLCISSKSKKMELY